MSRKRSQEKELDIGWKHCRAINNNSRHVICNYCNKTMYGGVSCLKEHLANVQGEVTGCKSVPKELKKQMKDYIEAKKKQKQAANLEKRRVEKQLMEEARGDDSDKEEQQQMRRAMHESQRTYAEDQMYGSSHRFGTGTSTPTGSQPSKSFARSKPFSYRL